MKKRSKKRKSNALATNSPPEKAPKNVPTIMAITSEEPLSARSVFARDINRLLNACAFVVVRGPIASGRTFSVAEAARLSDNAPLHAIYVNEDFDVKTLFGSYKCTDIPGEFVWTPSKFAERLREPGYVLLEEIDAGSPDLVAAILTLAERRECVFQSGERFAMHSQCRLLATVTTSRESNLNLIRDHPFFVDIPPLSIEELSAICLRRFPVMESIRERILDIFNVTRKTIATKCASDRQLNAKDLFRLCDRFNAGDVNFMSNIALFYEMDDVWLAHLANINGGERRLELAALLGGELSLSAEQVRTLLCNRKPNLSIDETHFYVGRVTLPRRISAVLSSRSLGQTRECCQLMERVARAIARREFVLLTGETGVGKTSIIQSLADYCGATLQTVNMSQDSEFTDLIGGFKPTPIMQLLRPLVDEYLKMFHAEFDASKNAKFLNFIETSLTDERVEDLLKLLFEASGRAARLSNTSAKIAAAWTNIVVHAKRLLHYVQHSACAFPFIYMAGVVTQAAQIGHWLLIDEINLAPSECLDAIMQIVDAGVVHENFRLFACMNPATDVGKRVLPVGIRSRFIEFFVSEPTEKEQLEIIIRNYLPQINFTQMDRIWKFLQEIRVIFPRMYSLRTLCRALKIVAKNSTGNLRDETDLMALAFSISFTSNLDSDEQTKLTTALQKHFGKFGHYVRAPAAGVRNEFVEVEGSFIMRGELFPSDDAHFIFTPSVSANLAFLASVVANGEFPILLEGETSAGKTSMIQHLARRTGNRVHRINNHEHTDVQEYIGCYAPNAFGHIEFVEGVLLKAVRHGEWIILDELNLAPSIVLEALNRLLDDNRELFVAELNETVVAHPRFRLFATQNPVGQYAGRKRLSAAFLNRFIILKYDHLPFAELPRIVEGRCGVAPVVAAKMIDVLVELRTRRSVHKIFAFANGLMTLRDLFRWANRVANTNISSDTDFDWRQVAVEQGFFVLAARCRNADDERLVVGVLETKLGRKIDVDNLFGATSKYLPTAIVRRHNEDIIDGMEGVIVTQAMRRMAILCVEAWKFNEAVLLVGETGCGKTTVVHLLDTPLSINCHERTETSDFLGSIRPTSDGRFRWCDGVVVRAMRAGRKLLVDEISLAPDSVLERLNSLLETDRSVLLTDGGAIAETIVASDGFQFVGTMNPGNDHGKKELSKALRNRFTEVWCVGEQNSTELCQILERRLHLLTASFESGMLEKCVIERVAACLVDFFDYFRQNYQHIFCASFTIRDLINMAELFTGCMRQNISVADAVFQALNATLFDAFGVIPSRVSYDAKKLIDTCVEKLCELLVKHQLNEISAFNNDTTEIQFVNDGLRVGPFLVTFGNDVRVAGDTLAFAFDAPTARRNLLCVARGLTSSKPIMLEGSPGAGKSSLIIALAKATGHSLVRLNLSEQTDLNDLFGGDVPNVTDNGKTTFSWRDGPVLKAIKEGSWVLLDEMNLASQSVLEGLNSCFDFRRNIYISELNKTFAIESNECRFFACQNPRSQGGDRKALPKSFLNRFTSIYVNEMTDNDYFYILKKVNGKHLSDELLTKMVSINRHVLSLKLQDGAPFEFNLRDLLRWAAISKKYGIKFGFDLVYASRIRNKAERFQTIFSNVFPELLSSDSKLSIMDLKVNGDVIQTHDGGSISFDKQIFADAICARQCVAMASQASTLRGLAACVEMNWLALLIGDFSSGANAALETLAALNGRSLHVLRLTAETDALELLGSYEQVVDNAEFITLRSEYLHQLTDVLLDYEAKEDQQSSDESIKICKLSRKLLAQAESAFTATELLKVVHKAVVLYPSTKLDEMSVALARIGTASFKWIDSEFVNAYRDGHWILVQDVNCCSAAVLDCLNCCLEDGGRLVLPEHSDSEATIIEKHPNFRVFFTMDPRNGALSRAMRNRSVEMFVGSGSFWSDDLTAHFDDGGRTRIELLNWIVMTALGKAWKATANTSYVNSAMEEFGNTNVCQLLDANCKKLGSFVRLSSLFQSGASVVELSGAGFAEALVQFCLCYPFSSEHDFHSFNNCVKINNNAIKTKESGPYFVVKENLSAVFAAMRTLVGGSSHQELEWSNDTFFFYNRKISWIDERLADVCLSSFVLNTKLTIANNDLAENLCNFFTFTDAPLTALVSSILRTIGYSTVPECTVLDDLKRSATELCWLRNSYWKLLFTHDRIRETVRQKLDIIGQHLMLKDLSNCDQFSLVELMRLVDTTLALLTALTPSNGDDDPMPSVSHDLNGRPDLKRLRVVNAFMRCARRFLVTVFGQCDVGFFDNLKLPVVRTLWKKLEATTTMHDEVKNASFSVYRPANQTFENLAAILKEFLTLALNFRRSVLDVETLKKLEQHNGTTQFANFFAQIESFLTSTRFFIKTIYERFSAFPDVTLTFTTVLNVLLISLNALNRRVRQWENKLELSQRFDFSQLSVGIGTPTAINLMMDWCLRENSSLPLWHQFQLVDWQILRQKCDFSPDSAFVRCVMWTFRHWRIRYDRSVEKAAKMFEYKSRAADCIDEVRNDDDLLDEDKIEFNSYFPNHSSVQLENIDENEEYDIKKLAIERLKRESLAKECSIGDEEIVGVLRRIATPLSDVNIASFSSIPYFTLMRLIDEANLQNTLSIIDEKSLKYHHLIQLYNTESFLTRAQSSKFTGAYQRVLDVYVESDYAQVVRCVDAVQLLRIRVEALYSEYPENYVLNGILAAISSFLNQPPTMPLMRLTAFLEKLLVEADQWQQLADRAHSIREETLVLQAILVDWRRLEVLCWADILTRIEREFRNAAILLAFPLFDTFETLFFPHNRHNVMDEMARMNVETFVDDQRENNENKLILMLIEWIQNASLVDFETRLFTGELLARFVDLRLNSNAAGLSTRIRLIVNYFRIFTASISDCFAAAKKEMEEKLKDFVEIFKYNDLNLWSVKQSTQKVHSQLFRIIKKFKEACREPVINLLFDSPLAIPASPVSTDSFLSITLNAESNVELCAKLDFATSKMRALLTRLVDMDTLVELRDTAADLLVTLQTDIIYDGAADEDKQKQEGHALQTRQTRFALLVRRLNKIGLAARRGLRVDSEALTAQALSHTNFDAPGTDLFVAELARHSTASRNVFRKRIAAFRLTNADHVRKQVPINIFGVLRGITEFGLHWTISAIQTLADNVCRHAAEFDDFSMDLAILLDNCKFDFNINHLMVAQVLQANDMDFEQLYAQFKLLADVLRACPADENEARHVDINVERLAYELAANDAIVGLTHASAEYSSLVQAISDTLVGLERVCNQRFAIRRTSHGFWKMSELSAYKSVALAELTQILQVSLQMINSFFPEDAAQIRLLVETLARRIAEAFLLDLHAFTSKMTILPIEFNYMTDVLLKIQHIYKAIGDRFESLSDGRMLLDTMKEMLKILAGIDLVSISEKYSAFIAKFNNSRILTAADSSTLSEAKLLSDAFRRFLHLILSRLNEFLREFSLCYLNITGVAIHLVSNGFVNAIPRAGDGGEGGETKEGGNSAGADDARGMGDAKAGESIAADAKNIANELDETGQIEGLRQDENNKPDDNADTPMDSETPIEMDEDFAGNLEDLDGEEMDEDDNSQDDENGNDLEDKLDWEKGDVKQPDERQLDPELWDKPSDAPPEPESVDDDDAKGADKRLDELVAKDDNSAPTDKQQDEEDENNKSDDRTDTPMDSETPIEIDEDFAGNFEDLDGEEMDENDNSQDDENGNDLEDKLDWQKCDVEETDEPQLDPELWDKPTDAPEPTESESVDDNDTKGGAEKKLDGFVTKDDNSASADKQHNEKVSSKNKDEIEGHKSCRKSSAGRQRNEDEELDDEDDDVGDEQKEESNTANDNHQNRGEIAERDDAVKRIDAMPQPRDLGDDEESVADEFDEKGSENFSGNYDDSQSVKAKHIVQTASMEEAARTRELFQQAAGEKSAHGEAHHRDEIIDDAQNEDDNVEVLQFERHASQDNDIILISEHIRQMEPLAEEEDYQLDLYEDNTNVNVEELDANSLEAFELRWSNITSSVSQMASMLAENLRIIIEPTIASRLQGDYRTGKRLNVRRLISYVASDYRKDRIWMRRTKKVKRNYQICVAVDDSASMKDNRMTTITCHSLCLIEKALRQLEVGQLMICKFGADVKVLSEFGSDASENAKLGAKLMSELTFAQNRTDLANLLMVVGAKFADAASTGAIGSSPAEQMLIVLGDGRGVITEGVERVRRALKRLDAQRVTVLFLVVDNGANGKSILDVKVVTDYERNERGVLQANCSSYMEMFPFPFYAIINDVEQLPTAISTAVQQWFEFTRR